jgi:RNA polymerase sigma-70 factor (ECF subfamily)
VSEPAAASDPTGLNPTDSGTVVSEFQRRLRAFVSRRVRNPADTDDVVQETLLRIHRHLPDVRSSERLTAWIFQVARSALGDHYRRHRPSESLNGLPEPVGEPEEQAASDFQELAACMAPMLAFLPAADRQAIELAEIKGLTQREAAAQAGLSLSGMKSRVQRARQKLRAALLDCCRIELDRRGGVIGHEPRGEACEPCQPKREPPSGASGRGRCG